MKTKAVFIKAVQLIISWLDSDIQLTNDFPVKEPPLEVLVINDYLTVSCRRLLETKCLVNCTKP